MPAQQSRLRFSDQVEFRFERRNQLAHECIPTRTVVVGIGKKRVAVAGFRIEHDPNKYGPIFKQRIRLLVGGQDTFFLNEAVALLKPEVEKLKFDSLPEGEHGYVKILPGFDHGSIFMSPEFQAIPSEMLEHLRRANIVK